MICTLFISPCREYEYYTKEARPLRDPRSIRSPHTSSGAVAKRRNSQPVTVGNAKGKANAERLRRYAQAHTIRARSASDSLRPTSNPEDERRKKAEQEKGAVAGREVASGKGARTLKLITIKAEQRPASHSRIREGMRPGVR